MPGYDADRPGDVDSSFPPPPAGPDERDDRGEEVAPTLSNDALAALDRLGSGRNAGAAVADADAGADEASPTGSGYREDSRSADAVDRTEGTV